MKLASETLPKTENALHPLTAPTLASHSASGPRLAFLDGIRGLAAFYIVIHHAFYISMDSPGHYAKLPFWPHVLLSWIDYGEISVAVFIVLSGYCLMLPVLRNRFQLKGGLYEFFVRRAWRILPPYYTILGLTMILIATVPGMHLISTEPIDPLQKGPPVNNFSPIIIVSHLFLFHNLKYAWKFGIVPPMWSIATEWWIYFGFALVLLPLWRRIGPWKTLLLTFLVTMLPHVLGHLVLHHAIGDDARPWFVGMFVLGMMAAAYQSKNANPRAEAHRWLVAALPPFIVFVCVAIYAQEWMAYNFYALDIPIAISSACLLCACPLLLKSESPSWLMSVLESRIATGLGYISYSLYLVHFPILWLLYITWLKAADVTPLTRYYLLAGIGTTLSLLAACFFYWAVERPFFKKRA